MQPATRHTDPALRLTASTLATSGRLEATRLRLRLAIAALAGVAVTVLVMSAYQRSTASWVEHTRIVYQTTRSALLRLGFSERQARVPALLIPVRGVAGEVVLYQAPTTRCGSTRGRDPLSRRDL